ASRVVAVGRRVEGELHQLLGGGGGGGVLAQVQEVGGQLAAVVAVDHAAGRVLGAGLQGRLVVRPGPLQQRPGASEVFLGPAQLREVDQRAGQAVVKPTIGGERRH